MENMKLDRSILCIDLKSFYASVECALLGLDPFVTPLVVADKSRSNGSVVLAVTPFLKARGVKSRCRVYELPNDPSIIYAKPQMKQYLKYSTKIIEIYLKYVAIEDIHIYSVDEVFLDLTSYLNFYNMDEIQIAKMILEDVLKTTKIPATCGIGPNLLLSKLALDIESKTANDFIAKWDYSDIPKKLWTLTPLSKMWGIGINMERNLNQLGIYSIGDLANYSLKKLIKYYGIIGAELYYHSHGIDMSIINEKIVYKPKTKSYGISQTLFEDYYSDKINLIILEMVDTVANRLRNANKKGYTIALSINYSKEYGGGFNRQTTLMFPTSNESDIYNTCLEIFNKFYDGLPIRKVSLRVSSIVTNYHVQMNLFKDMNKVITEYKLHSAMDSLNLKYGKNTVLRSTSLLKGSTIISRNSMIGGHNG